MVRKAWLRSLNDVRRSSPRAHPRTCRRSTPGGEQVTDVHTGEVSVIIIFGGTGMLGQHTAKELVDKGETVVVTGVQRRVPVLLEDAIERK